MEFFPECMPSKTEDWIFDLTRELRRAHTSPPHRDDVLSSKSIYTIPKILTDLNGTAYEPKLVSLSPYHYDRLHLRHMEEHKHRALIQFLLRIAKSGQTPRDVLRAILNIRDMLLCYYDNRTLIYDRDRHRDVLRHREHDFLKQMILDGCFVLEVMFASKRSATNEQSEYYPHDPVFGFEKTNYVVPDLKRDMLLLENQIPLLALTTLADIDGSGIGDVNALIKDFFNISSEEDKIIGEQIFHILDLYRKIFIAKGEYRPSYERSMQSATKLKNMGVSFCKSRSNSYRDISFNDGILSLPPLHIDHNTESLLLNLMAFERLHATSGKEVTAYAFFMNGLISTADDVALLRTENIITGLEGFNEYIANMFNNITKEMSPVVFMSGSEVDVNRELNSYCKKRMGRTYRLKSSFVQKYLESPWVFISLLGALLLLALTVIQTVYSMLQYYHT